MSKLSSFKRVRRENFTARAQARTRAIYSTMTKLRADDPAATVAEVKRRFELACEAGQVPCLLCGSSRLRAISIAFLRKDNGGSRVMPYALCGDHPLNSQTADAAEAVLTTLGVMADQPSWQVKGVQ